MSPIHTHVCARARAHTHTHTHTHKRGANLTVHFHAVHFKKCCR